MRLKGKNVLVVGLGRSGVAAVRFFLGREARVTVSDAKEEKELAPFISQVDTKRVSFLFGMQRPEIFDGRDLVCVSPGVPTNQVGLKRAYRKKIPVLGEMGVAALFLEAPMVAITGTNGKSTTSTLIHAILKESGQRVALAGNIGNPLLGVVDDGQKYDRVVVEVSSFQMETVRTFRPEVAVLLNITEDHGDRYDSFADYVRAKMRMVKEQKSRDWTLFNQESRPVLPYLRNIPSHKVPFSSSSVVKEGLFVSGDRIVRRWGREFEDYPLRRTKLLGLHNVENMMASVGAARACGVLPKTIQSVLENFGGLPHRMQLVREIRGIRYINDSKGTNVDAVCKSLHSLPDRRVILIAGGRHKGGSFSPLRDIVAKKVKALCTIGEASQKLEKQLGDFVPVFRADTLERAVSLSKRIAQRGDVVLLSPACASFDQFQNFEERGNRFGELVSHLDQG